MRAVCAELYRHDRLVGFWSAYAHNSRPVRHRIAAALYTNYAWSTALAFPKNTQIYNCGSQGVDTQTVPAAFQEAALVYGALRVPLNPNAARQVVLKLPDVPCTSWILQTLYRSVASSKRSCTRILIPKIRYIPAKYRSRGVCRRASPLCTLVLALQRRALDPWTRALSWLRAPNYWLLAW